MLRGKANCHDKLVHKLGERFDKAMKSYLIFSVVGFLCGSFLLAQTPPQQPVPSQGISLPAQTPSQEQGLGAAVEALKNLMGGSTNQPLAVLGKPAQPRELMALLPAELAGLRRTSSKGEKSGLLGAHVVFARGIYGTEGGSQFEVKITDLAALGPFGAVTNLGLMSSEIESEGDEGYERTGQYQGHKGREKYSNATKSGTATIMVNNRFLVEVEGRNIEAAQLSSALESLNLQPLDAMSKSTQNP